MHPSAAVHGSEACNHHDCSEAPRRGIRIHWRMVLLGCHCSSDLSEDVSASRQCPCNYFGECIEFNMSLANKPRQGMLQASSSWLTCTWHNVPCADRCMVAVWSSEFCCCKKTRHDWCCGEADSMNYKSLIRGCKKWFILVQNMVMQPHLSP